MNTNTPKPKPAAFTAPAVDASTVAAVIAATKAAEKTAALEKAGRVTARRLVVPIGGQVGRAYPASWRTKDSEAQDLPGSPCVWPNSGQLIEQCPGDNPIALVNDMTNEPWFREATPEEAAELASDQTAAAFVKAQLPGIGAKRFRDAVVEGNAVTSRKIEGLRKQLAQAEADLAAGIELEKTANENIEKEAVKLEAWVEGSGKSREAIDRAVELLTRPAPVLEAEPSRVVFAPGQRQPEDWRERLKRNGGVEVIAGVGA